MHYMDEDLIEEEPEDINMIDDIVLETYFGVLKEQKIPFPKEDPLNFRWTTEKLKEYIEEHWDMNHFLPWEYPFQFRMVGAKKPPPIPATSHHKKRSGSQAGESCPRLARSPRPPPQRKELEKIDMLVSNLISIVLSLQDQIDKSHFGEPDENPTLKEDARNEADFFWETAKKYLPTPTEYLIPVLDIEATKTRDPAAILGWEKLAKWIDAWMEEVKTKASLSKYPILYCGKNYADNLSYIASIDPTNIHITSYPLWIADLTNNEKPPIFGWSDWDFRQYAGDINGIPNTAGRGRCPGLPDNTGVDLDVFNGDINKLKSDFLIRQGN